MNMVSTLLLLILMFIEMKFLTLELLLPILELRQGNLLFIFRRSPNAKRIVNDPIREKDIAWGKINMPIR